MIPIYCSISENELDELFGLLIPSLLKQTVKEKIHLILVHYKNDELIFKKRVQYPCLQITEIRNTRGSLGFGEAINYLYEQCTPDKFFIISNTGFYAKEAIGCLVNKFKSSVGIIDARQLPYSHPKQYSQSDLSTNWASGACCLVNSAMFQKVGGFDKNFWMYLEDVDLSWRSWLNNYSVLHAVDACFYHYTGIHFKYRPDRLYLEDYWSMRNFYYLLYKFWGLKGERIARDLVQKTGYPLEMKDRTYRSYLRLKETLEQKDMLFNESPNKIKSNERIRVYGYNIFSQ